MKKWFFILALCVYGMVFALPVQDRRIDPGALLELTSAFGIAPDAALVFETQKRWLRPANQERWELSEIEEREFVLNWAEKAGFFDPWKPAYKKYDKALILGATTPRMQTRLEYLKKLWLDGVRFDEIVWLTGERPLDSRVDQLTDRYNSESEPVQMIWEETDLPEEMRKIPLVLISAPMKVKDGLLKRPNTEDTIIAWLKTNPEPCTALFVSDQPFCGYQHAVIGKCLPESFQYDVVGNGIETATHPASAAIILDSIARWLYTVH